MIKNSKENKNEAISTHLERESNVLIQYTLMTRLIRCANPAHSLTFGND